VDHRGGYVNMTTLHREIVTVAARRPDSLIHMANASAEFADDFFDLLQEIPHIRECQSWHEYLNSQRVQDFHSTCMGKWSNYIRAGLYRLVHHFPDHRFCGMDMAVGGDIPIGAGLSSSSSLLVSTSLAAIALNNLKVQPATFVDLCGEGEWFVGTRGGAADHAAMTLSTQGNITPITFFPFRVEKAVPFPEGCRLLIANSGVQSKKAKGARDAFNHRVACYELAMALFRKFFPDQTKGIEHLRDIPDKLSVSLSEFYQMVKRLPLRAGRFLLRQLLQDRSEWLEQVFSTHREPTLYPLRSVFMFGVAECERSKRFTELVTAGDLETIGRLMCVSHDGDRVVRFDQDGSARLWCYECDDATLDRLSNMAASTDPSVREQAALYLQPGGYACSCWEIDQMVDIALGVKGVVGAQLSGAGMGGCMMVLAREEAVEEVSAVLTEKYYRPRNLDLQLETCSSIAGASCLSMSDYVS
jgi:N-acetylgalactosamine kinase